MPRHVLTLPLFAALLLACAPRMAAANEVVISGFAFRPADLSVKAGTTVSWTNSDIVSHTVTADDGTFTSGNIAPGQTFRHTFVQEGAVNYHCALHPDMRAVVHVGGQ